jgi:hypothetical protein
MTSREGGTESMGRHRFGLLPQASCSPEQSSRSSHGNSRWIYRTSTDGSQGRREKIFSGEKGTEVCGWVVFILWWI